jgi:hypothetical protein
MSTLHWRFLVRATVAAAALFLLVAVRVSGSAATLAWALLVRALAAELLASIVFLRRSRAARRGRPDR